ncbi:uncharacterized protein EAF01_011945 [Botrytis porri]|uniref:uncharacterized protein n=1 Tax=Botrytis porri TaxID=87229 RepID=UPI0019022918|nr:uncharacterized protein EAF01_011945 [Botrytis porri]KAF7880780.1 hypothetical protein EAF01_011945 [Botrytis porri]
MRSLLILFSIVVLLTLRVSSYFASREWHVDEATPTHEGKYGSEETSIDVDPVSHGLDIAKDAKLAKEYASVRKSCALGNEGVTDPITHKIKRTPEQEWVFNECVALLFWMEQSAQRHEAEERAWDEWMLRLSEDNSNERVKHRTESSMSPTENQSSNTALRGSDDTTSGCKCQNGRNISRSQACFKSIRLLLAPFSLLYLLLLALIYQL